MDKRREGGFPAVGGSALLVIFAVLCLTIFALLTIATVQADTRLADVSARSVSAYYTADAEAEAVLAELRAGHAPAGVTDCGGGLYTYDIPISDVLTLFVEVRVEGTQYEILRWQACSVTEWAADESLPVFTGGF